MEWLGVPVTKEDIDKYVGFVYEITELSTGKKYVGIKKFKKRIRRKPLKGQKRIRIDYVESDWRKYNSSSNILLHKIKENPADFEKHIVLLCDSVTSLKACEAWWQLDYYMKGEWDQLFNQMINLRLNIPKSK